MSSVDTGGERPAHSPLPWGYVPRLSASENHKGFSIGPRGERGIGEIYPLDQDGIAGEINAAFMVRAVNSHEDLVAALELADALLEQRGSVYDSSSQRTIIVAALKKAREA